MLNKKQSKALKKYFDEQLKEYKRRKKYCAKAYSDWRDDEFNELDNKFIWAFTANGSKEIPSFCSLNDAIIYYNRATEQYIFDIDLTMYDSADPDSVQRMIDKLTQIQDAFGAWYHENCPMQLLTDYNFSDSFNSGISGSSLAVIGYRLDMTIAGIKHFYAQNFLDN